jgi:ubiquinone/menaquinone biosynthesis C-methylase UbiE
MDPDSVQAYDIPERVRTYDADMDIMHPLRWKMVEIALEILPYDETQRLDVLDLGVGTGIFARRVLETYVRSRVVAIDGATAMLEMAKARLGTLAERVEWVLSDFREIPSEVLKPNHFDVVISSYALHHLDANEKLAVLERVVRSLKPNGWFLNADIVKAEGKEVEKRIQELRVNAVTARGARKDERFHTPEITKTTLDKLEADEQDQPQTLATDLGIIRDAGITNAEVLWKEYRETVVGGPKPWPD